MRQIIVLSVALVVSLVGAYLTWTDDSEEVVSDDAVAVYSASEKDLQKLTWSSKSLDVTLEKRHDDHGDYLWVTTKETREPPKRPEPPKPPGAEEDDEDGDESAVEPGDEGAEDAGEGEDATSADEPAPEPIVTESAFLGNDKANELWKAFAPLEAPRRLERAQVDLVKFGFEDGPAPAPKDDADAEDDEDHEHPGLTKKEVEKATIEVVRGSGTVELAVGGETYGGKHRYVKSGEDVFLVDKRETLDPLQGAARNLVERSLFPFEEADIEQVDVSLPDGTAYAFVQQNRDDRAKAYWARSEALDAQDETAGTWLGQVFKLRLRDYVPAEEAPTELTPVLSYTVKGKGETWPVEVLKGTDLAGKTTWYAKSAYDRSLVTLSEGLVTNVVENVDSLQSK
ncbi:MAG: DUF4340 domain-containing protein [Bryobacterales bacterium]